MQKELKLKKAVALDGYETVAVLMLAKTFQRLTAEKGQQYLASVWMDFSRDDNDEEMAKVKNGIKTFFDLYFSTFGDFKRIEQCVRDAIPSQYREQADAEATNLAELNVKQFEGVTQSFEIGGFAIPQTSQELN